MVHSCIYVFLCIFQLIENIYKTLPIDGKSQSLIGSIVKSKANPFNKFISFMRGYYFTFIIAVWFVWCLRSFSDFGLEAIHEFSSLLCFPLFNTVDKILLQVFHETLFSKGLNWFLYLNNFLLKCIQLRCSWV